MILEGCTRAFNEDEYCETGGDLFKNCNISGGEVFDNRGSGKMIPEMTEEVEYGYGKKLASFRVLGMGVNDFQKDRNYRKRRIIEEAKNAVNVGGADSI